MTEQVRLCSIGRIGGGVAFCFLSFFFIFVRGAFCEEDCPDCETERFPEAADFLKGNGFEPDGFQVLFVWEEAVPQRPGEFVRGYHLLPKGESTPVDLYGDIQGALLDDSKLKELGIREKDWKKRPQEAFSEVSVGPMKAGGVVRAVVRNAGVFSKEVRLPGIDLAKALSEDERGESSPVKGVTRIGVFQDLPEVARAGDGGGKSGSWRQLGDGSSVWSLSITSPSARGQRVHFSDVILPVGASLVLYSAADPSEVYDLAGDGLATPKDYWTPTCFGETVVVECFVPTGGAVSGVSLAVDRVVHIYRELDALPFAKGAGTCNLDVTCYPEWSTVARGVGGIGTIGATGAVWCTGTLIVDTDPSTQIPYFLTAHHCVRDQVRASTIEVYWLYQTSVCNGSPPSLLTVPRTTGGATMLATAGGRGDIGGGNDFSLLRLRQTPPSGLTYVGWTSQAPAFNTEVTCIHHPTGSYKRISFGTLQDDDLYLYADDYHEVLWHDGTTEHGSSGSPLMITATQQIIGQLWGGGASCYTMDYPDFYGRFDVTFSLAQSYLAPALGLPVASFEAQEYSVNEWQTGITVTVKLTHAPGGVCKVNYAATSGTAVAGRDFEGVSGTLVFDGSQLSRAFTVPVFDDIRAESGSTIVLSLSEPVDCEIDLSKPGATILIVDNDPDSDGDGLSDQEETEGTYGWITDPHMVDTDGDGLSDYVEEMGTNGFVTDPTSFTELSALSVPWFSVSLEAPAP